MHAPVYQESRSVATMGDVFGLTQLEVAAPNADERPPSKDGWSEMRLKLPPIIQSAQKETATSDAPAAARVVAIAEAAIEASDEMPWLKLPGLATCKPPWWSAPRRVAIAAERFERLSQQPVGKPS